MARESLGRLPYIKIYDLNLPGRSDLSTAISKAFSSKEVDWTAAVSLSVYLKIFPSRFTGFSDTDGIKTIPKEKQCLSDTLPFLKTKVLDLTGLKIILAHEMSLSSPLRSHQHPGTDVAVTVAGARSRDQASTLHFY